MPLFPRAVCNDRDSKGISEVTKLSVDVRKEPHSLCGDTENNWFGNDLDRTTVEQGR